MHELRTVGKTPYFRARCTRSCRSIFLELDLGFLCSGVTVFRDPRPRLKLPSRSNCPVITQRYGFTALIYLGIMVDGFLTICEGSKSMTPRHFKCSVQGLANLSGTSNRHPPVIGVFADEACLLCFCPPHNIIAYGILRG